MKKILLSLLFVFALSVVLFGEVNNVFASTEDKISEVEKIFTEDGSIEPSGLPGLTPEDGSIEQFGLPDLTPISGAYLKTKTFAAGGRVDIDTQYFYMNARDALTFASKTESSIAEAVGWFGSSFIKPSNPYIASLGFLSVTERSILAADIRKYANKGTSVKLIAKHDNFYGFSSRGATSWDGRIGSVRPTDTVNEKISASFIKEF
ncbi:hypothetical protein V6B14_22480 (plasmid) [Sporosarcina psychrophila]|uniref:hypothetical protein n=1 Tax=Sporosarcina psychrophila TaxID=1476 RepID=UPI0030D50FD4